MILTLERLNEVLEWDDEIGNFKWRIKLSKKTRIGDVAGKNTYLIRIDGVSYIKTRLSWFKHYGYWPVDCVLLRDGDSKNIRPENLYLETRTEKSKRCYRPPGNYDGGNWALWGL